MGLFGLFGGSKNTAEDSLPKNDAEKWVCGIYALWSEYCGGSFRYIGGYEKTRSNASMVRGVLRRDWVISNRESMEKMVDYILDEKNEQGEEAPKAAFNYGCACNICARCYLGGYLTREELMQESSKIAKVIKQHYHSWEEFAKSYIEGAGMELGDEGKKAQFTEIYNRISVLPDGPYSVDWNTEV